MNSVAGGPDHRSEPCLAQAHFQCFMVSQAVTLLHWQPETAAVTEAQARSTLTVRPPARSPSRRIISGHRDRARHWQLSFRVGWACAAIVLAPSLSPRPDWDSESGGPARTRALPVPIIMIGQSGSVLS